MRRKNKHGYILISCFTRSLPKATGEHPIPRLNDHLLSPTIISDRRVFSNSGFVATSLLLGNIRLGHAVGQFRGYRPR